MNSSDESKGKGGPRRIQVVEPAAQGGGVGNAIGIFERRRGIFPRAPFHKAPPQRLATRDQTVMGNVELNIPH